MSNFSLKLNDEQIAKLKENFSFSFWEPYDEDHDVVRFVTSFMSKKENIDKLIDAL